MANRAIARYDGLLSGLRNPDILLSPMTRQEAVLSSRIEGTQATLGDVLKAEAGEQPDEPARQLDIVEILNYNRALDHAERELRSRPFSLNLLREMHSILLDSVRGNSKGRGEVRKLQNWIGRPGTPMEEADFVPPAPQQLAQHLDAWERFYHAEAPDGLVQLAVVHAQFEFLHPFLDGNGRLGRILVPLFLFEKRLLNRPAFYLSSYLEQHREIYVGRLRALGREPNAWQSWCEFFLDVVTAQAERNARQVQEVQSLYELYKQRTTTAMHSEFAVAMVDAIFEWPIFSTTQMSRRPGMPSRSAVLALLDRMVEIGILRVLRPARGQRPQMWICDDLLAICEH